MEEVYIDIRKENKWIQKYFDTDFVSISNLISTIEDLDGKIEQLQEEIKNLQDEEFNKPDAYDEWRDRQ